MRQNRNPTPRKPVTLPEHKPKQNRYPTNGSTAFVSADEAGRLLARRRPR